MGKATTGRRFRSRLVGGALAVLAVLAAPACSNDDDGGSAATTTLDVYADPPPEPTTTTETPSVTTEAPLDPGSTTTTETVEGEAFDGNVDGQPDGTTIAFTRTAEAIRNFTVRGLEIQCMPMAEGDITSRTVDVVLSSVPVGSDGMVDFTDDEIDYQPQLSGSFTADGRFLGGLFLSEQMGDEVCGGEFSFELDT